MPSDSWGLVVLYQFSWIEYAKQHGYAAISTNESESNILVGLYKAVGFQEVSRDDYFGPDDPNIILELTLPEKK